MESKQSSTSSNTNSLTKVIIALVFIYTACLLLSRPINLATADLGRHITNGQVIIQAVSQGLDLNQYTPLFRNFYSFTEPNYEVINHHWFTGVLHALIHDSWGFTGLAIVNTIAILLANLFLFLSARLMTNTNFALIFTSLALPLTCWRTEVRPEAFSYMLFGFTLLSLLLYKKEKISAKTLTLWLSISQLIWINLHIFFAFGLFLIGAFYVNEVYQNYKETGKVNFLNELFYCGLWVSGASLVNPAGLKGLLIPLDIFKAYAYMLIENQSVWFMHKRFPGHLIFYFYDFIFLVTLASFFFKRNLNGKFDIAKLLMFIVLGTLGFKTNRSIPAFAYASIFICADNFYSLAMNAKHSLDQSMTKRTNLFVNLSILIWLVFLILFYQNLSHKKLFFGMKPEMQASANFFKANNIPGPICNNYDIGGYLIYNLFPKRRVFNDNRPEAYSIDFFKEIYNPMMEDEEKWKEVDAKYKFNSIFFYRNDMTEHAQPFLIRRIADPNWVPVFVDSWNIILVKNNELNKAIIDKHRLPQEMFKTIKN